ncbi:hypothetical protein MNEG_8428 [Monoraphidium neglectum]|uniref:YbaK/aminoacyl-tRNA synthetase-associated domain-containing protein n=1 Tax=Monoraphidium neglectum TaxID=145388 RepID=A0A0D2JJQ9_9CHLO|nr:hypothetical protein MNEG_8428 [Monoraphidium neglectum]KIY99532.1 hypothetical protein MNEG_8428 [Monoraphidium neglectum]|eukprot:XP_013898552.1 hypothetical protein MNEG_8428 [Monoraphidium neglectum]
MTEEKISALARRLEALHTRIGAAERAAAVAVRLAALEERITAAEQGTTLKASAAAPAAPAAPAPSAAAPAPQAGLDPEARSRAALDAALAGDDSPVQHRLARELFVRVPSDYYERPLAWRREVLEAHTVYHLCKSIVMENTRAHPSVKGWEDPNNSKYYVVIVQYKARFNNEKLCAHLHKLNGGKVGKKWFNMRLAPEEVSDSLSGFGHNGVSPVGLATPLPIIISHRITQLVPDFFFMGGGEVDLKLGLSAADFVKAYGQQPVMVVDCTYDDDGGDEGGADEDEQNGS